MTRFKPKMEILPPAQQCLWPELAHAQKLGFVLYGGTAIALRLGHRPSVDFDFFTAKQLDRQAINATFPFLADSTVLQDRENTFEVLVPYGESRAQHVKEETLIGAASSVRNLPDVRLVASELES